MPRRERDQYHGSVLFCAASWCRRVLDCLNSVGAYLSGLVFSRYCSLFHVEDIWQRRIEFVAFTEASDFSDVWYSFLVVFLEGTDGWYGFISSQYVPQESPSLSCYLLLNAILVQLFYTVEDCSCALSRIFQPLF